MQVYASMQIEQQGVAPSAQASLAPSRMTDLKGTQCEFLPKVHSPLRDDSELAFNKMLMELFVKFMINVL